LKEREIYVGSWSAGFITSEPVVRQSIMAEGIVEQKCSPHGGWEIERVRKELRTWHIFQRHVLCDPLLPQFYYLPIVHSNFECITGLKH
jgi:hypothetical protein